MPHKSQTQKSTRQSGTSKAGKPTFTSEVSPANPARTELTDAVLSIVVMDTCLTVPSIRLAQGGQRAKSVEPWRYANVSLTQISAYSSSSRAWLV